MTRPSTVIYVDHATDMGGAEHSLLLLLAALDRERVHSILVTRPGPLARAAAAAGIETHLAPLERIRKHPLGPLRLARGALALRRICRRTGADLVHANVYRAAIYSLVGRPPGTPLVWHVRDFLSGGAVTRTLCRHADAVIAISRAVATRLPCSERAQVIYNPVPLPPPSPDTREQLGLPPTGTLVACVSRFRRWKGQHTVLEAARRVRNPGARFVFVGGSAFGEPAESDYGAELAAAAAAPDLAGRVTFVGQRSDLAPLWPHFAVAVHGATAEPFGRVVAEAQAAGVPVVAFNSGGIPEIVEDGASGLLVPSRDVAAMAAAIDRLLDDPALREALARRGRELTAAKFDPASHAEQVVGVYAALSGAR